MFRFFHFDKKQLIQNNIQLISVHIPKTAGTSFRNTLKTVYGEQQVVRLDIDLVHSVLKINEQSFEEKRLHKKHQVIHGHFSPTLLKAHFKIEPDIPFITWLRNPVDRVISNYYYLEKRLKEELNETGKGLNILSKMQRSLIEYAGAEANRNRMSKFLAGKPLKEFLFVGLTEYYSEDLVDLSSALGWEDFKELRHNVTGTDYSIVPQDVRDEIKKLNKEDEALYQIASNLRKERRNKLP